MHLKYENHRCPIFLQKSLFSMMKLLVANLNYLRCLIFVSEKKTDGVEFRVDTARTGIINLFLVKYYLRLTMSGQTMAPQVLYLLVLLRYLPK